ncbi:MAG TPA: acetyl-CoA hydrolase/transferase C-terminal domain-containing protein [Fimbriimonadaceae bacterium]|nr:acetyl-CoA hydrolase/transferase C-terminal domain-containing protein [Fimbriimonadaceae bacterium]
MRDSVPLKLASPEEAVRVIKSGNRIYIHGMAAAPPALVGAMAARSCELRDVEIVQMHTEGPAPYALPQCRDSFRVRALFVGGNVREAVAEGRADYVPVFLSHVPGLFSDGTLPLDVALIHVSPPDHHGFCSLGVSVEAARAAVVSAKHVIAQVNRLMPRTHGDGVVHVDDLDALCECDTPIPEVARGKSSEVESRIGKLCAELVQDGATLQVGIGGIPNAVLASLFGHQDLGVHSEMFSDGMLDLVERGVVTGRHKVIHPGKLVSSFVMGSRRLYDFVDDNPQVAMLDVGYVNNPQVIARNPKVTAINSAIEVDITGQVCADSIGPRIYSGVGGQMDFMRGAAASDMGVSIIALPSTTHRGESRIVNHLKEGSGVVTTRADVHYVVTEHGTANLRGKSLRDRARLMVGLAHPSHREQLEREAAERFGPL